MTCHATDGLFGPSGYSCGENCQTHGRSTDTVASCCWRLGSGIQAVAPRPVAVTLSTTGTPRGPRCLSLGGLCTWPRYLQAENSAFKFPPWLGGLHVGSDRLTCLLGRRCSKHVCSPGGPRERGGWEFSEAHSAPLRVSGAASAPAVPRSGGGGDGDWVPQPLEDGRDDLTSPA